MLGRKEGETGLIVQGSGTGQSSGFQGSVLTKFAAEGWAFLP